MEYTLYNRDDSPLYFFNYGLQKENINSYLHKIREDYEPPEFFKDNVFDGVDIKKMPPQQWFMIGPKRSGTNLH